MKQSILKLNDGCAIPQFGIGVYMIEGDEQTRKVCVEALSNGYRHIDTAHAYQNERGVGAAVRGSSIPRDEIWITSKLWPSEYGKGKTKQAIDKMLQRLDTDYIDLLLLHQQFGAYIEAWSDMEEAVREGKVRSIGLSNFESERLEEILEMAEIKPSVLQVECHPYYQQLELKKRIEDYDIKIESWYPLGHADKKLLEEPLFVDLSEKHNKSSVQIILRWHIQSGNIVFPKSSNPVHIKENIDVFDFELTESEMKKIRELDCGKRFYNMTLEQQEQMLGAWKPAD